MNAHFILLSGGSGSRMKSSVPKQFLNLKGKPVILHSAETFINWQRHGGMICVANPKYLEKTEDALNTVRMQLEKENLFFKAVPGGKNRHDSTLNGIHGLENFVKKDDLLFFHDAARPLLLEEELERLYSVFYENPEVEIASLVSPVTETLVTGNALPGKMSGILNRNEVFAVKTPQVIRFSSLKKMNTENQNQEFTDLLTWGEAEGLIGTLVEADESNIKLTRSSDLEILSSLLEKRKGTS
ncbi:MAG: 2-C-methyl-D-erythritol 4-phosphate cytidylyltransferase [Spirochaetia bacterium]|nr:2-C-methyl-D-erythritol 4-phosphate cytidylyltransferase [Spirochaetia bacterium]